MDLVRNTELPLKEFESIYKYNLSPHLKGLWCETLVALYLQSLGWTLVAHRKKISGIEIDLIFKTKKKQFVFFEIKSKGSHFMSEWRWSYAQKNKFEYVLNQSLGKYPHMTIFGVLCVVDFNKLSFYHLDEV